MTKHSFGGLARYCAVLTTALLAVPCSAQISVGLVDGPSTSASRGDLGKGAGGLLTGLHASHWRSIGDGGKASDGAKSCKIKGFRTVLRDQDSSTQETYRWVVRTGTDANGPTAGAAGLLHDFGPFSMPTVAAGGAHSWNLTVTLAGKVKIPCEAHMSFGVELGAAPQWPADGVSQHMTLGSTTNEHANAGDMTWQIVNGTTSHPTPRRAWSQNVIVVNPTLQMSLDGKKSMAGLYPKSGHRVFAGNISGGEPAAKALLFLSVDALPTGIRIEPGTAKLQLDPSALFMLSVVSIDRYGDAYFPLGYVPSLCPVWTLWFQAVICGKHKEYLTNAQATTFDQ